MAILSFLLPAGDLPPPGRKASRSGGNPDAEVQVPPRSTPVAPGSLRRSLPAVQHSKCQVSSPRSQPVVSNA